MNLNRYNNKKNIIYFATIIFIILFLFILIALIIQNKENEFIKKNSIIFFDYLSESYGYKLKKIEINQLKYIKKNEVKSFFDDYNNHSIFLIPIKNILKEIQEKKWVKGIKIKSNYKDTLKITIQEFTPRGIYKKEDELFVFNNQGQIIDHIKPNNTLFYNLIIFKGEKSLSNSIAFLDSIPLFLENEIEEAIFINNRRWDVLLKNDIILKLKEQKIKESFMDYKKIYNNISNQDLQEIQIIDLRLDNKAIIKFRNKKND